MANKLWKSCFGGRNNEQDKSKTLVPTAVIQPETVQSASLNKGLRDLDDACLEQIFWYLNYDDLMNVVLYDGQFRATAKKVFLQNYSDEYVVLSNISSFRFYNPSEMDRSIQLLHCFGDVITNLCIRFKFENVGYLIDTVKQRCGNNIRKLKLDHASQARQKCVPHEHGTLSVNKLLKCINKHFPNLRELHLIYGSSTDACPYWYDVDEMVIPSLTDFVIDGRFVFESFKQFIGLNPSIENLCVKSQCADFKWNIEYDFVPLLDNALPQLKYLEMSVACHVPQQFGQCYPVYLKYLKKFKSVGPTENVWRPNFYQFAGNELQELELNEVHVTQTSFIDSILHFKQLRYITIESMGRFSVERKTLLENDINEALINEEAIKVTIRKYFSHKPRFDLFRMQYERNPTDRLHSNYRYNV